MTIVQWALLEGLQRKYSLTEEETEALKSLLEDYGEARKLVAALALNVTAYCIPLPPYTQEFLDRAERLLEKEV